MSVAKCARVSDGSGRAAEQASARRTYGATARREVKRGWSGQRDGRRARSAGGRHAQIRATNTPLNREQSQKTNVANTD